MPRINNVDFLTLPQQVSKNKKDVESALTQIGGINQSIANMVVGKLSVAFANPNEAVDIAQFGLNAFPVTARQEFLQFVIANHQLIDKQDLLLLRVNLIGGVVHDVPQNTEYNVLFNITLQQLTNNVDEYYFRAVSNSSDVKFEIYAVYNALTELWVTQPTIIMLNTISNKTFYADAQDISGGVVDITDIIPQDVPVEKDDIVLSGSGFYYVDSVQGSNVNLNQNVGFVAPQGSLTQTSIMLLPVVNDTDKDRINFLLGLSIMKEVNSLEDQWTQKGLTVEVGVIIKQLRIGSEQSPTIADFPAYQLRVKLHNPTGSAINLYTGMVDLPVTETTKSRGGIVLIENNTSEDLRTNQQWNSSEVKAYTNLYSEYKYTLQAKTLDAGKYTYITFNSI